jgi:hypothetical protein
MKKAVALTLYDKLGKKAQLLPEQMLYIMQSTPKDHIYQRPAKGGGVWDYVTGVYVKKVLNYVFGWNWDFEVKEHGIEGNLLWVLGKLTVRTKDGKAITKEQFGRAETKKRKDGTGYLDFGNDLKAATTDALKKCASEFGIASDVYGKNEFREIKYEELADLPKPVKKIKSVIEVKPIIEIPKKTKLVESEIDIAKMRSKLK